MTFPRARARRHLTRRYPFRRSLSRPFRDLSSLRDYDDGKLVTTVFAKNLLRMKNVVIGTLLYKDEAMKRTYNGASLEEIT